MSDIVQIVWRQVLYAKINVCSISGKKTHTFIHHEVVNSPVRLPATSPARSASGVWIPKRCRECSSDPPNIAGLPHPAELLDCALLNVWIVRLFPSRSATPCDETSDDIANCRCQYSVLKHSCVYSGDQPAKLDKLRHGAKTFQTPFNTLHLTKKSKNCHKVEIRRANGGHGPWKPWHSPCSWKSADSWRPTV